MSVWDQHKDKTDEKFDEEDAKSADESSSDEEEEDKQSEKSEDNDDSESEDENGRIDAPVNQKNKPVKSNNEKKTKEMTITYHVEASLMEINDNKEKGSFKIDKNIKTPLFPGEIHTDAAPFSPETAKHKIAAIYLVGYKNNHNTSFSVDIDGLNSQNGINSHASCSGVKGATILHANTDTHKIGANMRIPLYKSKDNGPTFQCSSESDEAPLILEGKTYYRPEHDIAKLINSENGNKKVGIKPDVIKIKGKEYHSWDNSVLDAAKLKYQEKKKTDNIYKLSFPITRAHIDNEIKTPVRSSKYNSTSHTSTKIASTPSKEIFVGLRTDEAKYEAIQEVKGVSMTLAYLFEKL